MQIDLDEIYGISVLLASPRVVRLSIAILVIGALVTSGEGQQSFPYGGFRQRGRLMNSVMNPAKLASELLGR